MHGRAPARALTFLVLAAGVAWCSSASADPLACQARASYEVSDVSVEVSFVALVAGGNAPLSFHWDFGDGSTSTEQNPSHTYTESGVYWAWLTVTDASAFAESCRDTVIVTPGVIAEYTCFTSAAPRWSDTSDPIDFSVAPGFVFELPPYTWTWNFGDGTTSTEQYPSHAYATPGTYWAAVTLHANDGTLHRECGTIRVTTLVPQVVNVELNRPASGLRLEAPRPNPFKAATTLAFSLAHEGRVCLAIVDVRGRLITTLMDEIRPAGPHVAMWEGRAKTGELAPPGLYFAVVEHEGRTQAVRVARLR